MEVIEFNEQTVVIAKDQPEYLPLLAGQFGDDEGRVIFCWKMTWRERVRVLLTGTLWQQVLTFNQPLQPQKLETIKPDMSA